MQLASTGTEDFHRLTEGFKGIVTKVEETNGFQAE